MAASQAQSAPATAQNAQAQLEQNRRLGLMLYQYDQSAWHVTDAALPTFSDQAKQIGRGYVTTPAPNGLKTTFFGELQGKYVALYSAVWTGSAIEQTQIYQPDQRFPLNEEETRLILARKIALDSASSLEICGTSPPNIIVVPDGNDGLVHVYILTPQPTADTYSFGGHHRIDVKDGKVIATRKFANTCISMDNSDMPAGARPAGFVITHLLDPIPTEIHVFNALASKTPVAVGIAQSKTIYWVDPSGGQPTISKIQE